MAELDVPSLHTAPVRTPPGAGVVTGAQEPAVGHTASSVALWAVRLAAVVAS